MAQQQEGLLDINTADVAELERLPFVGRERAEAIVAHRDRHGPFTDLIELKEITGFGGKLSESLQDFLTVGRGANGRSEERSDDPGRGKRASKR